MVRGRRIVLDEHLASPALPDGVRFLRDVDLPPLVEMAGNYDQVPDLYQAYLDRVATVSLPDFLGALSVLLARECSSTGMNLPAQNRLSGWQRRRLKGIFHVSSHGSRTAADRIRWEPGFGMAPTGVHHATEAHRW